jgi:undecaprenyl-diphosphatase
MDDKYGYGEVAQDLARWDRRMDGHQSMKSINRGWPVYPVGTWHSELKRVAARLQAADDATVHRVNAAVRASAMARTLAIGAATGLAGVEVLLMAGLALGGSKNAALKMVTGVALVYLVCDALGARWPRRRPFARLAQVEALVVHTAERSFPSRHVASGLAMAVIGGRAHPRLGRAMAIVAWLLGLSRMATGLHYPSDVLAGALVGIALGRLLRRP